MADDSPLHHQIWEREIEKLETFAECIVQFVGCEDEFWRLFDKAHIWGRIFACRIWGPLSVLCDHQMRYLSTLNKCLDIKLFRDFFRHINVLNTFLRPLLDHLVHTSFHEPFEHWDDPSKMAFAVIYKIHTLDFETKLEANLNELNRRILEDDDLIDFWKPNQAHNDAKLSETLQIYWQLFCTSNDGLAELKIKRSIVECDDCIPLHDPSHVSKIRQENMVLILTLPADKDHEEQLLRRFRPFIVNVCSPPAEEDRDSLISLLALQTDVCPHNMSRYLLQDREIIRRWVRLVLTYRPCVFTSWSCAIKLLQAILRLFTGGKKWIIDQTGDAAIAEHWSLVEDRISWFGETYCELVHEDPRWSLGDLVRGSRYLNIQFVVVFSAILLYNGTLLENDQLDIIHVAVNQYNEILRPRPSLAVEYRYCLALLQLCLHREICVRVMLMRYEEPHYSYGSKLRPTFFVKEILDHSAFRFLNADTPMNLFRAAILTIEVALSFKAESSAKISSRFKSRLKQVINAGGENEGVARIVLNEIQRVKRVARRRKKRKQKKLLEQNQKNCPLKMEPVTMASWLDT